MNTTVVTAKTEQGPKASTHYATCPACQRTTWIRFQPAECNTRRSCHHFRAVVRIGDLVSVEFETEPKPAALKAVA